MKHILTACLAFLLTGITAHATTQTLNRSIIFRELIVSHSLKPELRDNKYILPSSAFVKEQLIPFYLAYAQQNLAPALDNDALSIGLCHVFQSIAYQANIRGGGAKKGDVPVGVIRTRAKGSFDLVHKILIRTETGWYVMHPNNGELTQLIQFRKENEIFRLII